jgi:hypothetical protein
VLYQNRGLRDHAWDQDLVVRQLDPSPLFPLVLVSRIRRFKGVATCPDLQNDVDDIFQFHVMDAWPHVHEQRPQEGCDAIDARSLPKQ